MNKVNDVSVNKVYQTMEKFSIKMYKYNDILFKEVTTLVPLFLTPKLYDIFLCHLALRQNI